MDVATALVDFVSASPVLGARITALLDANEQLFVLDFDEIAEKEPELATMLQKNFAGSYDAVFEAFRAHTLASHGRSLDISFCNPTLSIRLRDLRSDSIGTLLQLTGTVTRTSQVRPELTLATFVCQDCRAEIPNVRQDLVFRAPRFCPNHLCTNRTRFDLLSGSSVFRNWQRVHVQESVDEIPRGSLPRTIDAIVRDSLVEQIRPGCHVTMTGFCVAVPRSSTFLASSRLASPAAGDSGSGSAKSSSQRSHHELSHSFVFICIHFSEQSSSPLENFARNRLLSTHYSSTNHHVAQSVPSTQPDGLSSAPAPNIASTAADGGAFSRGSTGNDFTMDQLAVVRRMQAVPSLYENLAESLFPTIYGHSTIKAAILLMLVGGVSKRRDIRLRGDINILLVGDPGTAKSQFLKQTAGAFPCSVYTSGKSSSAAGLTAAVVKDSESGEFTIEAGALMLSDGGVCCIDEFDKMSIKDRVAIHEAMEQQTITIAKAGINATLNSRASVLAAANPLRGKYDSRKTLRQNVNLSAPIMSRFDLFFVLVDEVDAENDMKVAAKILDNHVRYNPRYVESAGGKAYHDSELDKHEDARRVAAADNGGDAETSSENSDAFSSHHLLSTKSRPRFSVEEVILYVLYVRGSQPVLSKEAKELIAAKYTELRQDSLINTTSYRMTARHLESLVRLSEALAKIHNDPEVNTAHVMEAYRLVKSSVVEVSGEEIRLECKESEEAFVIKNKEYLKITNTLVYLLKAQSSDREDLCVRYLEMIEKSIDSERMLESEREKCMRVIQFLVESEGVLYEVDGLLNIHPNYDS